MRSVPVVVTLTLLVLVPFLYYQTLPDVFGMVLNVPHIHAWLSGCAHNVWWLWKPAPPFHSDREVLLLGLRAIDLGLLVFALCVGLLLTWVHRRPEPRTLILASGYMGLAFFSVVIEIHENHLFAAFPFLAVGAVDHRRLRWLYCGLSFVFSAGLVLTLWMLETGYAWTPIGVRVDRLNAFLMVGLFVYATGHLVRQVLQDRFRFGR